MAGAKIALSSVTGELKDDGHGNAIVTVPGFDSGGVEVGGGYTNGPAMFSENDTGEFTGVRRLRSPETDDEFRLRTAQDNLLDTENFNYTSGQNTGKHRYDFVTMTSALTVNGFQTNSGSSVATTVGVALNTHAYFPFIQNQTIVAEQTIAFSQQPTTNGVFDVGLFLRPTSNPFAPTDGVYFRFTASGIFGVCNRNGVETLEQCKIDNGATNFTYVNNDYNVYLIQSSHTETTFWINDILAATIPTPAGQTGPVISMALPWSFRHAHVGGAAGVAVQALIANYAVISRGADFDTGLGTVMNRVLGSYQGLSGNTMGSLATYPNSTNPTAAAPSNTALTANLPGGLGGQGAVTAAAAAATDGIWSSVQVPQGSSTVQGRRLRLTGVVIDAVNMGAAVATTATTIQFSLAFGHTAVSLATAETASLANATTKAPRRVPLGFMNWPIGAAIGAGPDRGPITVSFLDSPIYVNPGEFIALVGKFINGTATASQVINFTYTPIYSWE